MTRKWSNLNLPGVAKVAFKLEAGTGSLLLTCKLPWPFGFFTQPLPTKLFAYGESLNVRRYSLNSGARSGCFNANSTVAIRKPSLSPASYRVPSKRTA